jgi:hypothetical protein
MSQPETSHPYYWSGFAIIGDGAAPVIPAAEGGAKQTACPLSLTKKTPSGRPHWHFIGP